MFPRLSDLIEYLFGISTPLPVQTYGFFVAMAFLTGGFLLYLELNRKEKAGQIPPQTRMVLKGKPPSLREYLLTGLLFFVVGAKITGLLINYDEFMQDPQDYLLSFRGSFLGGALAAGIMVYLDYRQAQKEKLEKPVKEKVTVHPKQLTNNIILVAAVSGIIGAKLFDMIEHLDEFFRDPFGVLFSFSGLSFYGGLIVAAFAVGYYGERNKINWPVMADAVAPALMLAYAVGRIGCQLSGDGCWGIPNPEPKPEWLAFAPDWMWSFTYPHNVIKEGVAIHSCSGEYCFELAQPVFPTPFYETVICTIFFIVLWSIRKSITIPGILFSIYLILNGTERFLIEFVRVNIQYNFLGIQATQAQFIAILLILAGISGLLFFNYKHRKKP
jgi:phosphatidylglycerol---prolipoprotein diacylglyceryl transferase